MSDVNRRKIDLPRKKSRFTDKQRGKAVLLSECNSHYASRDYLASTMLQFHRIAAVRAARILPQVSAPTVRAGVHHASLTKQFTQIAHATITRDGLFSALLGPTASRVRRHFSAVSRAKGAATSERQSNAPTSQPTSAAETLKAVDGLNVEKPTIVDATKEPVSKTGAATEAAGFSLSPAAAWRWLKANKAQFQILFKTFGWFTVATYLGVYCVTLGGIFGLVRMGLIEGPDAEGWINNFWIKKLISDKPLHLPEWSVQFATAWVITKLTEPVRLVTTIALVPLAARRMPPQFFTYFGVKPEMLAAFRKGTHH